MKDSTTTLCFFAQRLHPKRYLEIGLKTCETFNAVSHYVQNECIGVDPDPVCASSAISGSVITTTSDLFFETYRGEFFDMVFIDGLHEKDQAKKDFENSVRVLSDEGWIFIHDTFPPDRNHTAPNLCGNVWEFALELKHSIKEDWEFITLPWAYGITCIRRFKGQVSFQ